MIAYSISRWSLMPLLLFSAGSGPPQGEEYRIVSPDGAVAIAITVQDGLTYSVWYHDEAVVLPSVISVTLASGREIGAGVEVIDERRRSVNETIEPVVAEKTALIRDHYNELTLDFRGGWGMDVRAYDDGVAYRFRTRERGEITIAQEGFSVEFRRDPTAWFPTEESFLTHSERQYEQLRVSEIPAAKMASIPVLVGFDDGLKLALTESDLRDYPGLYLTGTGGSGLKGVFPAYPLEEEQVNDRTVRVVQRADYIARTSGPRTLPWRAFVIAADDADLIGSTFVYRLAPQLRLDDPSWIRPGQVAWDWWNANNVYGVDFAAGVNTATYLYYIDFAADHGIEYVILDEGWSDPADLWRLNPDIDMTVLLDHARERGVGIILWVVWKSLDDSLDAAMDRFAEWGVAGIKVDFMQRDDQPMVDYYWKVAEAAARHRLLVDFHGAYKPAGLRRAYPNVITREGVLGLEHSKWSAQPTPEHNVTIPFTRMLAGPMDYTPGAMNNAQERQFHPVFDRPMSLGTRTHQLAMYVVFESPLQMLADSPTHYLREPECLAFIAAVPTVWDETTALSGQVGDWVLVARRRGETWYVGAMTDWNGRELRLDLAFLGSGEWRAEVFADGVNAARNANDYRRNELVVRATDSLSLNLAPGGGWVARFEPAR